MAETQEIILEINVKDSLTKTAELKASINELIAQRQDLAEAAKKGDEDSAKALEAVNVAVRLQQQEYRTQTKILDGYVASKKQETDTLKFANNSIQQNRDLLKQLTAQYITLKSPLPEATQKIKDLSDALKIQESAIGNTARNVGNYKSAFVDAFKQISIGGVSVSSVVDPLKNLSNGFKDAGGGAAGFSAILLGGIPIILAGIQSLITVMQKFDSVSEGLEDTMSGVNQSFDYFVGHANDGGFEDLINGMTKAYDEGVKLSQVMRELQEAQDVMNVTNAQANKEIESLLIKSKDRTKADAERIAMLDMASEKEKKNLEENIKLSEQRVQLAQIEFKRVIEARLNDDEAKKALNKANVDLINQQRESGNLQEKILNRRNALLDEIKQKEEKLQAQKKAADEKAFAESEKLAQRELANQRQIYIEQEKLRLEQEGKEKAEIDAIIKAKEDAYNKQLSMQNATSALYLKKVEEDAQKEIAIQKQKEQEIQSLISYGLQQASNLVGLISQVLQDGSAERLESFKANAAAEKNILDNQLESGKVSKKKYNQEIARIDAEARKKEAEEKKKQWEIAKGIQIVNAVIQTAQATISAFNAGASYGPAGVVLGPVFAAVAAALGAAQIGIIASQQPPKFAKGGKVIDIGGNYHEHGGTPIHVNGEYVAEAEKDEGLFIMKKDAYQAGKLSNWNQLYGGNSWGVNTRFAALGGAIPTIEGDGGFVSRDISRGQDQAYMMQEAIRNGFALAPSPKLSIVEFETRQAERNRSVNVSEGR